MVVVTGQWSRWIQVTMTRTIHSVHTTGYRIKTSTITIIHPWLLGRDGSLDGSDGYWMVSTASDILLTDWCWHVPRATPRVLGWITAGFAMSCSGGCCRLNWICILQHDTTNTHSSIIFGGQENVFVSSIQCEKSTEDIYYKVMILLLKLMLDDLT